MAKEEFRNGCDISGLAFQAQIASTARNQTWLSDVEQDVVMGPPHQVNTASTQASGTPFLLMEGSGGSKVVFLANNSLRSGRQSKMEAASLTN